MKKEKPTYEELAKKVLELEKIIENNNFIEFETSSNTSESQLVETALKESEERYKTFINSTNDLAFIKDENFRYVLMNKANLDFFGLTEKEVYGKTDFELMPVIADTCHKSDLEAILKNDTIIIEEAVGNRIFETRKFPIILNNNKKGIGGFVRDITEQKLAINKIQKSEREFHAIFNSHSAAIALIEADTTISMVNDAYCKMSGYTIQEAIGLSWTQQIPPDDLERLKEYNRKRLINPNDAPFEYEFSFYHKNGEIRYALMSIGMIENEKRIIASFIDISNRKKAEEVLHENEEKFRSIYESINMAILLTIPDGTIISANDYACMLFGMTEKEICQKGRNGIVDLTDPRLSELLEKREKTGKVNGELIFIKKDGTTFEGEISSTIFIDREGKEKTSMLIQDLSVRKQAESALRISEERYRLLVESTDFGFVVINEQGFVVTANEPYRLLAGMKNNESCIGRSVIDWTAPEEKENNALAVAQCVQQGFIKDFETIYQHADGKREYVLINANMQKTPDGKNHIVSFCRNITERKLVENDLEMLNSLNFDMNMGMSLDNLIDKSRQVIMSRLSVNHVDVYLTSDDGEFLLYRKENVKKEFITAFEKILPFKIPQTIKISLYKDNWYSRVMLSREIKITESTSDIEAMIMAFFESNYEKVPFKKHLSKIITFFKNNSVISSIPLVLNQKNIALLDVNFKSRPTENDLKRIKSFSEQLVVIIDRKRTEEALQKSEEKFHALYDNMIEGAALHELKYNDQGVPEDYVIIEVNSAFEKQLGLSRVNIIGRTSRKAYGVNEPPYFEKYVRVVQTGKPEVFETYFPPMEKHFSISVYSPFKGSFATIFEDITDRKKTEEKIKQHNELLLRLNLFSVELSMLPFENDLEAFIVKQLKEITGAEVVLFNEYDYDKKAVIVKHIEMNPGLLEKVIGLLGKQVKKFQSPVSEAMYQEMVTEVIGRRTTLHDASFGAVSRPVSSAIQALLKVDRFIGMAYQIDEKLFGTSLIALKKGQPDIPDEILETFVYLSTMAIIRKKTELALHESEKKYRVITEKITDVIWLMNLEGKSTFVSSSIEKFTGYTVEEYLKQTIEERFTPESAKYGLDTFARELQLYKLDFESLKNYNCTLELEYKCKNNSTKWGELLITPFYDEQNTLIGIHGVTRDINERKKAEEMLILNKAHLSNALEIAHLGHWEYDVATDIFTFNDQFFKIFRTTVEQVGGYTMSSAEYARRFVYPDDLHLVGDETQKAIETSDANFSRKIEHRILYADGTIGYISVRFFIVKDVHGRTVKTFGVNQDITERKKTEESIIQSKKDWEESFDSITDMITMHDNDYNIIQANKAGKELLKLPEIEKHLKFKCFTFYHGTNAPPDGCQSCDCFKTGLPGIFELFEPHLNRYLEIRAIPRFDSNHQSVGMIHVVRDISERKKAEESLKESEEKFFKAFMTSPYAISITDAKTGKFIEVNDHFSLMSGYSREEILANSSIGLEMWVDIEDRNQVIADILKGKKVSGKEYKFLKKNRETLVGLFSADLISLNNKSYILSSINDITESVKAKNALFESEKKYRLLADNSADVIFIFDLNFKYTYISPSIKKLRGYDPEDLIGQSVSDSLKPEGVTYTQSVIKEEMELEIAGKSEANRSRALELEMFCKDGSTIWTEAKASLLRDEKNNPIGIIGVTRDITERKKAENALIKSKEKTEELLTITQKQKSEIELQNERLESLLRISQYKQKSNQDLLNYALNEAIELTSSKIGYIYFYNEETKQFTLNTWSKEVMNECAVLNPQTVYDLDKTGCWGEAVRQRKPIVINNYSDENQFKKGIPQGHVQLSKFLTIPVFMDNAIVAVVGVANKEEDYQLSDVRQLTLLMDSVWRSSERENMIENLKKSKEKAEESDRLKSAFLANMSHEIRTPMNGILGFAELLTEPGLSGEKQSEYINIIENSGKRMLNIINDIVDISKIESGQIKLSISTVNINEQIEYLHVFFKPEIEQKGMQIFFKNSLKNEEVNIRTDKVKVVAVLTNLVKNAIKFTHKGSIEFGYEKKGKFFEFFVKDTGAGINQEQKNIIFERFRQGSESLSRNYEGAGLGLSISKAYVEMLGGRIWVESNEGEGSVFYFTIPYNVQEEEINVAPKMVSNENKEIQNKKLKVLIADDEETSEKLISIVVGKFSSEILTARNGVEAVELCRKNPDVNLIMMDVKMPELNGYEATKQIRQFNNKVIIIAQTAYALAGENEKAIEAGCNDYISKPINKDKLTELMQKYF